MLQVVLAQHPIAGSRRVPRQLLVLLEDVLGVAADLDVVGPVGLERAVDVVLRLAAAATTAATAVTTPVAATLPLHTLEISHQSLDRFAAASGQSVALQSKMPVGVRLARHLADTGLFKPRSHSAPGQEHGLRIAGSRCVPRVGPLRPTIWVKTQWM